MSTILRPRRTPLERSLPKDLYYSINPETAKKLIHIKLVRDKLRAMRRSFIYDFFYTLRERNDVPSSIRILEGFKERQKALEECYSQVELSSKEILVWIPVTRRKYVQATSTEETS